MKKQYRIVAVLAGVILLASLIVVLNRQRDIGRQVVGVIEPMSHVAISDITRAIRETLAERADLEIRVSNANGDSTTLAQIINGYRDAGVSIYLPIFTKTTQAVLSQAMERPVVFAAVTDPVAAGIVKNPELPESNVTGVSDLWPIGANLDLVKEIVPEAWIMGIVYDPGDASASVTMPLIIKEAEARGFKLELRPVHSAHEVASSLAALQGRIHVLFTANDVTVTAAFPALVEFAISRQIPLFAADYSSVQRGAISAVGQNYYNVGVEAARMVASIADGHRISSLPVKYTEGGDIYVNTRAAELMGIQIPSDVLAKAKVIYANIGKEDQ